MGTVEQDLARHESEVARADAENAALERACDAEIQRLEALTVKELLEETDLIEGRVDDFCGWAPLAVRHKRIHLDLDAVLAMLAEHNVRNVSHD